MKDGLQASVASGGKCVICSKDRNYVASSSEKLTKRESCALAISGK